MSWVNIVWPFMGAASLTLGLIHFLIWAMQRSQITHLVFAVVAVSVAAMSIVELMMLRSTTTAEYALLLRAAHVPYAFVIVGIATFVRLRFAVTRTWLFWLVVVTRLACLPANVLTGDSLNFVAVTEVRPVLLWGGEVVQRAFGQANPWMLLGQISTLLLVAFLVDTAVAVWRRGRPEQRFHALLLCGSLVLFLLAANVWGVLVVTGLFQAPFMLNPAFVVVILAMSYDLGGDVLRAARIAGNLASTESDLRASRARMDIAVRAARIGLWDWDVATGKTWFSEPGLLLLGFAPNEKVDQERFLERVHPDDRGVLNQALATAAAGEGDYECEYRTVGDGDRTRWIASRGRVGRDASGTPQRVYGVVVDVTHRKESERDAALQREELAHLSRVALLAELSGSIAHELNQPLTAILSNAQAALRFLARDPPDLAEVGESLANVVENDKRAGEVIRRLRAMLRKEPAALLPLNVNEVVQDVLRLVRSDLLNRNVETVLDFDASLPEVDGDRVQLQQVVMNLAMNGCDAMQSVATGRVLTLRTRATPRWTIEVAVSDRGTGIPETELERIFTPFVTTKSDGMGLGLAVCRTIVDAHGGRMWARNNTGRPGATVAFELPVTRRG